MNIVETAHTLSQHRVWLFFKLGARFLSPLVASETRQLTEAGSFEDRGSMRVVERLGAEMDDLEPGIYSPVPIARGLDWDARGGETVQVDEARWRELLGQFRYETIQVDEDQVWWWKGTRVAPRVRKFFAEHLRREPELGLWSVEYRIHDDWYDKCYLEGVTPLLATALELEGGAPRVVLEGGDRVEVDLGSLRLDGAEHLSVSGPVCGEIRLSEGLRFSVLKEVADDLRSVTIAGVVYPLSWPEEK